VKDGNASDGKKLYAMPESVNLGNNTNWVFVAPLGSVCIVK
jgi:hypothetical protein